MVNRGQLVLGAALLLLGAAMLFGTVFHINVFAICFPLGLVAVGIWLIRRPNLSSEGTASELVFIGDLRRVGAWTARNEEIWLGVGDVNLDFTTAEIPPGETRVVLYGFVGDVDIQVPGDIGVSIHASGFVVESKLFGDHQSGILSPVFRETDNYAENEHRLCIEITCFVVDLNLEQLY